MAHLELSEDTKRELIRALRREGFRVEEPLKQPRFYYVEQTGYYKILDRERGDSGVAWYSKEYDTFTPVLERVEQHVKHLNMNYKESPQ